GVFQGKEAPPSRGASPAPAPKDGAYILLKLKGGYTFQKVAIADLDGDARYDCVIKQPRDNIDPWHKYWKKSPETYKLEAYRHDGTFLWRYDMGWAIERGIWYSPYVVYDLDGDGKAEVAVKTGKGDPRGADGKVQEGPEYITILDGLTGKVRAQGDWPGRKNFTGNHAYNYASRNQLCVAYLDGKTPSLIVERGTYNIMIADAYEFRAGKLRKLWRWTNKGQPRQYWGQGAHWMHAADVDGDGRDEVLLGSAVIDDNGRSLWSTGLGHPDHCYIGDLDPGRPGLEVYYGMETRQKERNGMCMVDAKTGKIIWGHEGFTRHVHSRGMCSDIDARYP
ncbi:MAG: silent information regulator protein Sir2, partial [Phycisphaerae bacterium]|nr:silent information regulator protein Sir2 [Phycisphaerae bacterium]